MRHGFIKTAAGTPKIQVADCVYNAGEILKLIRQMETEGAKIMAFPELCITGYTCQDLFWQTLLLDSAREQLIWLAKETSQVDALIIVGLPWEYNGKLYNVAAVLNRGTILGLVPKTNRQITLNIMRQGILHRRIRTPIWLKLTGWKYHLEQNFCFPARR